MLLAEFERIAAELESLGEAKTARTVMSAFLKVLSRAYDDILETFTNPTVHDRAAIEAHVRTRFDFITDSLTISGEVLSAAADMQRAGPSSNERGGRRGHQHRN